MRVEATKHRMFDAFKRGVGTLASRGMLWFFGLSNPDIGFSLSFHAGGVDDIVDALRFRERTPGHRWAMLTVSRCWLQDYARPRLK